MNEHPDNSSTDKTILAAQTLSVGYGERLVIPELSLQITMGTITALVGPNGSGKSTLLKALARLIAPRAGSVSGQDHRPRFARSEPGSSLRRSHDRSAGRAHRCRWPIRSSADSRPT